MEEQQELQFEQEQKPEYGKKVYLYFWLVVAAMLASYGMKSQWQQHVPVRQVSVEGISIISRDEIIRLLDLPKNVSLYNLDLMQLQRNIQANSFVKNVVVKRDMPNLLRVEIEERIPAAMLVHGGEIFYLDEDGALLPYISTKETYDIPVISGADSLRGIKTGSKVNNADVLSALEIIRVAKIIGAEMHHAVSEIKLRKGHDIILYSFENGVPIIFGQGETEKKLVKFDEFLKRFMLNSDLGNVQYIDIRFDDQVVVSQKNS